jgi:hypothetical protein
VEDLNYRHVREVPSGNVAQEMANAGIQHLTVVNNGMEIILAQRDSGADNAAVKYPFRANA